MNQRTIQGFSTNYNPAQKNDDGEFYPDIQKFIRYYGDADYADKWIDAARRGGRTTFSTSMSSRQTTFSLDEPASARQGKEKEMDFSSWYLLLIAPSPHLDDI